jgi:rhodanese-related sulfurtransferase
MNRFLEYTTHHPLLVGAAALLAIVAIVMEIRQQARGSNVVGPSDAVRLVNGGALVLDVRDAKDYEDGHIIDSRHIPSAELANRADTLKKYKDRPVVVYCDGGFASAAAAKILRTLGFGKVVTLRGGLQSWRQDNLPLVKGAAKKEGKNA